MLIRGWQHVAQELPDAKLLLIGDGPEKNNCEQLAQELGIEDSIEFWGIRHDVADILRSVDVFTLTSVSEAASLTLLEAMASECPAVVTEVGGNSEHINDGEHGYLIPRGDHKQLGICLTQLLKDREMAQSMGQIARQRVVADFNLETVLQNYLRLYRQLAPSRQA